MRDTMQSRLQTYYARAFPAKQGLQVTDLLRITGGWESEMYAFDVAYGPTEDRRREALVLRLYPGDQTHAKAAHAYSGDSCHLIQCKAGSWPLCVMSSVVSWFQQATQQSRVSCGV